mgnify:FL=1
MIVAVIPARGGSKRIPKKNIKKFFGKPIISYSIKAAIDSKLFDKVIVSTDCENIAQVAINYGAEVPFMRPEELSGDFLGTHEVVGHALKWLEDFGDVVDYACCIYATAPMIQGSDLIKGYDLIKTEKWKAVIAATKYSYPVFRSFKKLPNGGLEMVFPEHYNSRSQDLPEVYHDAGQFYWAKAQEWKNKPGGFSENNTIIELSNYLVQDIDTIEDWNRAEKIYENYKT